MKTTCCKIIKLMFFNVSVFAVIIGSSQSVAAKVNRVAIVPFQINAEKDLSFLRDGIVDMLTSRLCLEDKVAVLSREETAKVLETVSPPINESKARKIGTRLGVDYVLFGSLTVFGDSVSMDAKMVDVSESSPPLTFFNQSQGMDQVIPNINLFATQVNAKVFGRAMPVQKVPVTSQTPQTQTLQDQMSYRANPEKLFAGGGSENDNQDLQKSAPGLAFLASREAGKSAQFWSSRSIRHRINGIAIGDIDKDGNQETVIITEHSVEAYRFEKNRFFKVKILAERHLDNFIGVDVADINGNGYPEIFVTSLNPLRNMVNSFVLEFDGKTYTEIVTGSHWYFRVIDHPLRGQILLGQRPKGSTPFSGQIHEMVWENSGYEPANKIGHGRHTNVMGFALGNVMNDDTEVAVAFDDLDYLRIFNQGGKERWKDSEHSGGRVEYFVVSEGSTGEFAEKAYYPMRILIMDITGDGKNEVVTVKNHKFSEMVSYRKFTHGEVQIRSWNGVGLAVNWRTRKLKGYFSDFAIGDFDNDGNDELVAPLVIETGLMVAAKPKSKVIAYELK